MFLSLVIGRVSRHMRSHNLLQGKVRKSVLGKRMGEDESDLYASICSNANVLCFGVTRPDPIDTQRLKQKSANRRP